MTADNILINCTTNTIMNQAILILDHALEQSKIYPNSDIGLTTATNLSQTEQIRLGHSTNTSGAEIFSDNGVIHYIGIYLAQPKYRTIGDRFKIIPISTMTADQKAVTDERVKEDLTYAKDFAEGQHLIIWGNQHVPIAIGGEVTKEIQPEDQNTLILETLSQLLGDNMLEEIPLPNENKTDEANETEVTIDNYLSAYKDNWELTFFARGQKWHEKSGVTMKNIHDYIKENRAKGKLTRTEKVLNSIINPAIEGAKSGGCSMF